MKNISKYKVKIVRFAKENKWILFVMMFLLIERLIALQMLGINYSLNSDDVSYINSGITFIKTGTITMHGPISAQIMPGMTVFIGILYLIFGEGIALWLVLKLTWIIMGVMAAFFTYKCVSLFTPKWCGVIVALFFAVPDFVWMDNLILTETPFMLFFIIMIYSTLMMGKTKHKKYFWCCLASFMCAFMLKANIGVYPIFAFIYLLLVKYDFKTLIIQGLILGGIMLAFIIPWSIRNYIHFDAFIPLTYGAGNPMLLGTYQGEGYPEDESLDYEKNVEEVAKEKLKKYYNKDGKVKKEYLNKFILLKKDEIKAKYRISEWKKNNFPSYVKSYLYSKPVDMMKSSFYWNEVFGISKEKILTWRKFELLVFGISIFLTIFLKKRRIEALFLTILYLSNIYIYATTFSFSRYAQTLLPLRYILIGISIPLMIETLIKGVESIKSYNEINEC